MRITSTCEYVCAAILLKAEPMYSLSSYVGKMTDTRGPSSSDRVFDKEPRMLTYI